jgi:hypothetical protein
MLKSIKSNSYYKFYVLLILIGFFACNKVRTTNYYFHPILGSDQNLGTSKSTPFKTLSKTKDLILLPGDSLLLAANEIFTDALQLKKVSGTEKNPLVISSYSKTKNNDQAIIKTTGFLNGVLIENSSFIEISNLKISASPSKEKVTNRKKEMRCGVLVQTTEVGNYQHIYLSNVGIKDVFFESENFKRPLKEVKSANGTQNYGWGIRFINNTEGAILNDLKVDACIVKNVSHTGIKFTSKNNNYGITNFVVSNTRVTETGGPGIQMSGVKNGHIYNNLVDKSGSNNDSRKWGRGSGLWTWGSSDILIENNSFTNASGPADSAGAHIDYNCNNTVLQYNFSANNAGGFCEILGNNYNCAYRYNISVNDGYRVKGEHNAFQEGKIFWLSGYSGKKRKGPFNSYFYNNTIYVKKDINAKVAIDRMAKGILIANNIFHIERASKIVKGDQYNPEKKGKWMVSDVFFKNNLFLYAASWPKEIRLQDENPIFGNANFKNNGGLKIADYTPSNKNLIKNKGIRIPKLSNDTIGLIYGLQVEKDILGSKIIGLPDLGAIEIDE